MRKYILLLVVLLLSLATRAQRVAYKKYKIYLLDYPQLKSSDIHSINFKIYNPKSSINQDSLRSYSGTMNLLNDYVIFPGQFPGRSINPVSLVNQNADINIEVAFGQPEVMDMQTLKGNRNTLLGGSIESYYYTIKYRYPAIVRMTKKNGRLLDIWQLSSINTIYYGKKKITQRRNNLLGGEELLIYNNIFTSASKLDKNYLRIGRYYVKRQALILQLKKAIEDIYDRIYFLQQEDKFEIASGRGRKYNYNELNIAQDNSIKAIESKNFNQLTTSVTTWEKYLDLSNNMDKKSMINSKIKAGLLGNLTIAYMYLKHYKLALDYADAYVGQATFNYKKPISNGKMKIEISNNLKSSDNVLRQAYFIKHLVNKRSDAFKNNKNITVPDKLYGGVNFKKEIGRKDKNYKYNLFSRGDNFALFTTQLNNFRNIKEESRGKSSVTTKIEVVNPYESKLQNVMGSKLKMLNLNFLDYPNLENSSFPSEVIALKDVGTLNMSYFGFTSLPDDFGKLDKLTSIEMYRNKLASLPESIGKISNLININFAFNELTSIPVSMCNLNKLKTLNLSGNKLSTLPNNIGNLASLVVLNLKSNHLSTLPASIKNCSKLKRLALKGNNISDNEMKKIKGWLPNVKIK